MVAGALRVFTQVTRAAQLAARAEQRSCEAQCSYESATSRLARFAMATLALLLLLEEQRLLASSGSRCSMRLRPA